MPKYKLTFSVITEADPATLLEDLVEIANIYGDEGSSYGEDVYIIDDSEEVEKLD